ncbi:MAG: hypothetical protein AMJ92_11040 [candidate division Zixibacteria bacterium SM23_81]|nr:MAG: hypothetical protein AMJ92_11040 [candidate division Zixibacteria bacterium SM23_81]
MADFTNRMIRAAKLDVSLYEEVEADKTAMGQAMMVVILSGIAAGVGNISRGGVMGIIWGTILALVGWYVWAFLTYFIGAKLLPEPETKANHQELLRTIGFSSSPGILRVLGIIPGLGSFLVFVASVWMLIAMIIAVKQALDYSSTWRAVGVCIIGWIIQMIFVWLLVAIFGGAQAQL